MQPYLAANEAICLEVFAAAGLATPNTTLSADGELLLVERFDVLPKGEHLGFEEAAALMGETGATKYQRDYGTLTDVLGEFVGPNSEPSLRQDLTLALVLNWLLGNGDAHLKNFGVLYKDDLDVSLAPFYDCVATLAYVPEDVPALALSFDWYSKAWWPRQKVEDFSQTYGRLTAPEMARMFDKAFAAVDAGLKSARRLGKQIPGFLALSERLRALWVERRARFRRDQ